MNTSEFQMGQAIAFVRYEMDRGLEKFGRYNSRHEAYAVILEELDELWDAIKTKGRVEDGLDIREAIQVAATALRYVVEFGSEE